MNASYRAAQRLINDRRRKAAKRCISTRVEKIAETKADAKAVTAALRKIAKKKRETGELGRVQTRVGYVAPGVVGNTYRYNAAQLAACAVAYRPRKDAYKAIRAALIAA